MKLSKTPKKDNSPKRWLNSFIVKLAITLGIALWNPSTNIVVWQNVGDENLITFVNKNYKPWYDSGKFLREKDYVWAYKYQLEWLSTNYMRNFMEFPKIFKIWSMESITDRKQFYDLTYQWEPIAEKDNSWLNLSTKWKNFVIPTHFVDIQVDCNELLKEYEVNQGLQKYIASGNVGLYIDRIDVESQVFIRIFLYDNNYAGYLQDLVDNEIFHMVWLTSYLKGTHKQVEPLVAVLPVEKELTTNTIEPSYQKQESSSNVPTLQKKQSTKNEARANIKNVDASNSEKDVNVWRKWFVAYGQRIDHSACTAGDHSGGGQQSQQCGKIIKTKSYHWADNGKVMTQDEVIKYIWSDN